MDVDVDARVVVPVGRSVAWCLPPRKMGSKTGGEKRGWLRNIGLPGYYVFWFELGSENNVRSMIYDFKASRDVKSFGSFQAGPQN